MFRCRCSVRCRSFWKDFFFQQIWKQSKQTFTEFYSFCVFSNKHIYQVKWFQKRAKCWVVELISVNLIWGKKKIGNKSAFTHLDNSMDLFWKLWSKRYRVASQTSGLRLDYSLVSVWVVVSLCGRFSVRGDHVEFYTQNVGKIAIIVRVEPSGNPQESAVPQSPKKLVVTPPPPTPPPPPTSGILSTVSTAAATPISSGHLFLQSDINKVNFWFCF